MNKVLFYMPFLGISIFLPTFAAVMKLPTISRHGSIGLALVLTLLLTVATLPLAAAAQRTDPRCLSFLGIPLEGHPDSLTTALTKRGFTPWGEDDEGRNFRGQFYGMRCKLLIDCDDDSGMVTSASVVIGPYSTKELYERNLRYFLMKLQKDYGEFALRNGAYIYFGDYGLIKVSNEENDTGARNIKVFFFTSVPFYKDAATRGLRGSVMEVVTTNPVAENAVEHFDRQGRLVQADLTEREYDPYGYLLRARMKEENGGYSVVEYEYDDDYQLVRRTLTNSEAGIRYVNDYAWNDDGELATQSQKVYDKKNECVMSLVLKNQYEKPDDEDNWTQNKLSLTYWDPESGSSQTQVIQKRTINYWE